MIYNFPFYPQYSGRMYPSYSHNRYKNVNNSKPKASKIANNSEYFNNKSINNYNINNRENRKSSNNKNDNFDNNNRNSFLSNNNVIFEIFGIKLHYDDILLICLIFFLYKEGVKDESLFISLILLLLS